MKKSIAFLPRENKEDLKYIVSLIVAKIPVCEMIILYGSYARGTFVRYDERVEFGIPTTFQSDYDIAVVTSGWSPDKTERVLGEVKKEYYRKPHPYKITVQIIHDTITKVNKDLDQSRFFYTELKKDGIMLYDSGNYKLARRRKLRFDEIKEQAEEYFETKYRRGNLFLQDAKFNYERGEYVHASFHFHQACENFFKTILLVFILKFGKEHNLLNLLTATRGYVPELYEVFPLENKEQKRLFDILVRAYIEARYNFKFVVTKEENEVFIPQIEKFAEVTKKACLARIEYYQSKARNRQK